MNVNRIAALAFLAVLAGCAAPSLNRVDADNAARQRLLAPAEQGDAQAQYELGASYCCGAGFYNTAEAIKWWCLAARQGHLQARQELRKQLPGLDVQAECKKYS